jgi:hypothetical protein
MRWIHFDRLRCDRFGRNDLWPNELYGLLEWSHAEHFKLMSGIYRFLGGCTDQAYGDGESYVRGYRGEDGAFTLAAIVEDAEV